MAIALSGGINTFGKFPAVTRGQYITGATFFLLQAGFTLLEKVKAFASGIVSRMPVDGTQYIFAGQTYTFRATINNAVQREVALGVDIPSSMNNLVAAVNAAAGSGTTYSRLTFQNAVVSLSQSTVTVMGVTTTTLTVTARVAGPDGSGITSDLGILLGGGYLVQGQSPQDRPLDGLQYKFNVYLFDNQHTSGLTGHPAQASVQIISAYDGTLKSTEYHAVVGSGLEYQIICCQCQAFIYRVGVDADPTGSVMAFGIPNIPQGLCGTEVQSIPTNEVWWISCDEGLIAAATPRTVITDQQRVTQGPLANESHLPAQSGVTNVGSWFSSDACFNGVLIPGGNAAGQFRMCSLTPPNRWDIILSEGGLRVDSMRWFGPDDPMSGLPTYIPMLFEPIVAWANIDNTNPPLLRGQMYDGWIRTQQEDMDATSDGTDPMATDVVQVGLKFVAFTDRSKFGTLWLIVPSLTPVDLTRYQAAYAN